MKIKSGIDFTLCLTDRGEVYYWGNNICGQLGIDTTDKEYHKPTKIDFILGVPIRYISVGNYHAAAIDFDYNVYIWGHNDWGQLGLGDKVDISSPTIIEFLTDKKVEKIYCKNTRTFAITQGGEVYSWGSGYTGNFGIGYNNYGNTITKLIFPNNTLIKKLYIGMCHSFAIDTCSKIYSWGYNYNYQLCKSDNIQQNSLSIANKLEDFNIKKIICLISSTIILADNKLYFIGCSDYGELGIEKTREITLILEGVEKVWGDWSTIFCRMCNGDLYAWGLNEYGQLGIGNKINQNSPLELNIDLNIKSINFFWGSTYATTANGEIYTWGKNELVSKESILEPTLFTYFIDNDIGIKTMNRIKSARKID